MSVLCALGLQHLAVLALLEGVPAHRSCTCLSRDCQVRWQTLLLPQNRRKEQLSRLHRLCQRTSSEWDSRSLPPIWAWHCSSSRRCLPPACLGTLLVLLLLSHCLRDDVGWLLLYWLPAQLPCSEQQGIWYLQGLGGNLSQTQQAGSGLGAFAQQPVQGFASFAQPSGHSPTWQQQQQGFGAFQQPPSGFGQTSSGNLGYGGQFLGTSSQPKPGGQVSVISGGPRIAENSSYA